MNRLRGLLVLFFLSLAIPSGVLIHQAFRQMQWEAFHQQRLLAEELASRIDERFQMLTEEEESRSFADYQFLIVSADPGANFLQRSQLSAFPPRGRFPGLLGHFQVDSSGAFSTPLLPDDSVALESLGIPSEERAARLALGKRIHALLSQQNLVQRQVYQSVAAEPASMAADSAEGLTAPEADLMMVQEAELEALSEDTQVAFDELKKSSTLLDPGGDAMAGESQSLGRVADLNLDSTYSSQLRAQSPAKLERGKVESRKKRKEQAVVPQTKPNREQTSGLFSSVPASTFDAEIDPFSIALLDNRHFVLFRHVWRDGQRYVQGAVIEQAPFIRVTIESPFQTTALSRVSGLVVGYRTDVLRVIPSLSTSPQTSATPNLVDSLLYRTKLGSPFSELELIFSVTRLPLGPGGTVMVWSAIILFVVLVAGFVIMYRLGLGQLRLHRQQQDFVSAVSHELKTPLTSIRNVRRDVESRLGCGGEETQLLRFYLSRE